VIDDLSHPQPLGPAWPSSRDRRTQRPHRWLQSALAPMGSRLTPVRTPSGSSTRACCSGSTSGHGGQVL